MAYLTNPLIWGALLALITAGKSYFIDHASLASVLTTLFLAIGALWGGKQQVQMKAALLRKGIML